MRSPKCCALRSGSVGPTRHRIRRVDAGGTITTVAGSGQSGFSGDGGPAVQAQLNGPAGVTSDGSGGFLIADPAEHVRTVMTGRLGEDPSAMNHAAALGILSRKSERIDPRQRNRSGAHGAGLQRHPQSAAIEPRPAEPGRGMADGNHFRMGRRVEVAAH